MTWIAIFAAMFAYDGVWAAYVVGLNRGQVLLGSTLAGTMPVFMAVMTRGYVADWSNVIPAVFGAFAGTYVGTVLARKMEAK